MSRGRRGGEEEGTGREGGESGSAYNSCTLTVTDEQVSVDSSQWHTTCVRSC